jgi:hypothetical protein
MVRTVHSWHSDHTTSRRQSADHLLSQTFLNFQWLRPSDCLKLVQLEENDSFATVVPGSFRILNQSRHMLQRLSGDVDPRSKLIKFTHEMPVVSETV